MKTQNLLLATIILIMFSNIELLSQNCVFKVNEKDKFTGKTSLLTVSEIVNKNGKYVYLELLSTNGEYFVTMNYTEKAMKANGWSCTNNDPLIFLFSDETKLTLYPVELNYRTQKTRMDQWGAAFIGSISALADKYIFAPKYNITREEFMLLNEKTVTSFRITAKGTSMNTMEKLENIDFDVDNANAVLIKNDSKCIITNDNNNTPSNSANSEKQSEGVYIKVMNPAFAEEFEKIPVTINAEFFSPEGWKGWSYPSKVKKYVLFQCINIGSAPTNLPFLGEAGNVFCINKEKSDIIFTLKRGDKIKVTGTTYTQEYGGSKTVYFIATDILKL